MRSRTVSCTENSLSPVAASVKQLLLGLTILELWSPRVVLVLVMSGGLVLAVAASCVSDRGYVLDPPFIEYFIRLKM